MRGSPHNQRKQKHAWYTHVTTYMEDCSGTTKYEINWALNVAVIIVMSTFLIKESVVSTVKCTMIKCHFVCRHICCHRLVLRGISNPRRCLILQSKGISRESKLFLLPCTFRDIKPQCNRNIILRMSYHVWYILFSFQSSFPI